MASLRQMRASLLLLLWTSFFEPVSSQTIVPTAASSTFPSCAVNCAVLLQAQAACIPPAVATTNDLTYENCFCQNSLLAALYSTPDSVCASECNTAESDRTELQTWFTSFCSQVGQGVDPLTATTASPTATTVVTITSTNTPAPTSTGSTSASASTSNKTWIQSHWRWILMLAILIVGFALLAWGAVWFKRRHRRKVEQRRTALSGFAAGDEKRNTRAATPDLWGPHQHMHHNNGWEYGDPALMGSGAVAANGDNRDAERRSKRVSTSRHKGQSRASVTELGPRPPSTSRQQSSSKGTSRARNQVVSVEPEITPAASRSRSRGQKVRNADGDLERNGDQGHERRLREVRGSRRP